MFKWLKLNLFTWLKVFFPIYAEYGLVKIINK